MTRVHKFGEFVAEMALTQAQKNAGAKYRNKKKFKAGNVRRVQSGWYTVTIVNWEQVTLDQTHGKELHFDLYKQGSGKYATWSVSSRDSHQMDLGGPFENKVIANFDSSVNGRKYLEALAKWALAGGSGDPPHPGKFEDYADFRLSWRAGESNWRYLLDTGR